MLSPEAVWLLDLCVHHSNMYSPPCSRSERFQTMSLDPLARSLSELETSSTWRAMSPQSSPSDWKVADQ